MNDGSQSTAQTLLMPVLMVIAGLCAFSIMDAVMKGLSIAIGAYNAVFWRYCAGFVIVSLLYFPRRRNWPSQTSMRLYLIRGPLVAVMAFLFFWGLARTPLAEAIALSFIAPLIALYLAALLLGERIGRQSMLASLLGIAGVVVILIGKMGAEFGPDAQWGVAAILLSAACYAYNLILQRQMALLAGPIEVAFFQNVVTLACLLAVAPFFAVPPPADLFPALGGAAVLGIVSLLLVTWGYARAEAQHLVSLEYSAFVWAALFGWLWFGETVTWATLAGTVLIVSGCLIVARQKPAKAEIVEAAVG